MLTYSKSVVTLKFTRFNRYFLMRTLMSEMKSAFQNQQLSHKFKEFLYFGNLFIATYCSKLFFIRFLAPKIARE